MIQRDCWSSSTYTSTVGASKSISVGCSSSKRLADWNNTAPFARHRWKHTGCLSTMAYFIFWVLFVWDVHSSAELLHWFSHSNRYSQKPVDDEVPLWKPTVFMDQDEWFPGTASINVLYTRVCTYVLCMSMYVDENSAKTTVCICLYACVERGYLRADQSEVQSIQIQWLSCLI